MTDASERPHERIEAALAQLGAEHEPPAGWESRVLAATTAPRRRPWWMYAAPGLALAAAAVVIVHFVPGDRPAPLALRVELQQAAVFRGSDGHVGDVVHIAASGGGDDRAIWIYRDQDQLVLRCPGDRSCRVSGDSLAVDLQLTRTGDYRFVALTRLPASAAPTGSYAADLAAAREAGAEVTESPMRVP